MLAGVAAFISILLSRHATIIDRLRRVNEIAENEPASEERKAEIPHLKRRAFLMLRATYLALLAGISTTLLLMIMVGSAFLGLKHAPFGPLLFGAAAVFLCLAQFRFSQEVRLALSEIDRF